MKITAFTKEDLYCIPELQPSDWHDISPDIKFYVESKYSFPFKIECDNQIVAMGACILHEDIAWLGHIMTHKDFRQRGYGKIITKYLVDFAYLKSCKTINLIATELGFILYEKLGFKVETEYLIYKGVKEKQWQISSSIVKINNDHIDELKNLDAKLSGEERFLAMKPFLENSYIYQGVQGLEGYYIPDWGDGMIVANTKKAGIELMKLRLKDNSTVIFPMNNLNAQTFMEAHNYKQSGTAKRMRLGDKSHVNLSCIYNRIGGNIG